MEIDKFIDRAYVSVSVLEEMQQLSEWLQESDYLTVIDEELKAVGIVTLKDAHYHPHSRAIECNISKPHVEPNFTVFETINIMKAAHVDCLPVYKNNEFIGVISLISITEGLIEVINSIKQTLNTGK